MVYSASLVESLLEYNTSFFFFFLQSRQYAILRGLPVFTRPSVISGSSTVNVMI